MDFKWMAVLDGKHRHIYSDKKQVKRQRGGFRRPFGVYWLPHSSQWQCVV